MLRFKLNPNTALKSSDELFVTEEEKKKMGRPIVGAEPKNVSLRLNLTKSEKKALEEEAKRTGKTMTQVVSEFIKTLMK